MIQRDIDISLNILKYSPNVKELLCFFRVYWCILDGADCNRQFIQMHFKDNDPEVRWPTSAHRIPESHTEFK